MPQFHKIAQFGADMACGTWSGSIRRDTSGNDFKSVDTRKDKNASNAFAAIEPHDSDNDCDGLADAEDSDCARTKGGGKGKNRQLLTSNA